MNEATPPSPHPTDERLLACIASEEREALSSLYDRWAATLLGIGMRFNTSRQEVEDVVHDVFFEIWKTAKDFDPDRGSARTWIVMKMRCRMLDHVRKQQRHRALAPHVEETMPPATLSESPDVAYAHEQLRARLALLPDRLMQVLVLTYFEHLPAHEIGARLDVPTGTVKSRIASARRELKRLLEEPSHDSADDDAAQSAQPGHEDERP